MRKPLALLAFLILLISCKDRNNILVTGQITDAETGQPISKAEVVVLCWYMNNIEDASFRKQTLSTDNHGNYRANFDNGHQVDVASKANGFVAVRSYNELEDNHIQVNLKLQRLKQNPTLISYLNTDNVGLDVTDKTPFLRIRIHSVANSTTLNLKNVETFGFDFKTQRTISDTSNCDIWFKPINKDEQPNVLIANENGGVTPVYSNEINSSFFYEKTVAPKTGYIHEYKFKGNEEGFFVLCSDGRTYGKIIFEKSLIDAGSPYGEKSYYKDIGRYFSCLYQTNGTTDLSYSTPDIDLENFLVDGRLR